MSDDLDERTQLRELRQTYQRNLAIVEKQRANYGDLNVPINILNQISEYEAKIAQIDRQLEALNPAVDGHLRTQAFIALAEAESTDFTSDLTDVEHLWSELVKADPHDDENHKQLAIIRRHQQFQRDYAAIGQLRSKSNWRAVELALTKLAQRVPNLPDPEGHGEWVKEAKIPPHIRQHLSVLQNPDPTIHLNERLSAAEALAQLGDPRRGVCNLDIDWCDVLAGTYIVGSDNSDSQAYDYEKPTQKVALSAFKISKYCVTNAQWQQFMDAGGYRERRWWGEYWQVCQQGWDWNSQKWEWQITNKAWTQPRFWDNAHFNQPNQPVVGVSWYEAMVFCTWLSEQLGYRVTLPTEAHWEVAARGTQRFIYPWGNDWNAVYANADATGLERTTPVGCYPHGASWCGALDMCGNVWEWTLSDYTNPDRSNQIDITNNSTNVSFRGGSWYFNPQFARAAARLRNDPLIGNDGRGLRLFRPSYC